MLDWLGFGWWIFQICAALRCQYLQYGSRVDVLTFTEVKANNPGRTKNAAMRIVTVRRGSRRSLLAKGLQQGTEPDPGVFKLSGSESGLRVSSLLYLCNWGIALRRVSMLKMEIQNDISSMVDAASSSLCVGYTGLSSPHCLLLRCFMD